MKKDIEQHEGDNLGGVNSWRFAHANEVNVISPVLDGKIHHEVTLIPGARWYEGYGTPGTMYLKEDGKDIEHGEYQEKEFGASIPKDRPELVALFNSNKNRPFVIDLTYNNGTRKLVGSKEEPMYLKTSLDSKQDVPQRNEYRAVFKGTGVDKSPFYNI